MTDVASEPATARASLGIRPARFHLVDPALAPQVVAPSSDSLDAAQRREIRRRNPLSYLHVLEMDGGESPRTGAATLARLLARGVFTGPHGPAFAYYRMVDGDHRQTGLVAAVSIDDYDRGRIKPHEQTRPEHSTRLTTFLETVGATSSPVCLTYPSHPELQQMTRSITAGAPDLHFTAEDGLEQTVWVVRDAEQTRGIAAAVAGIEALYVTDGHHRLEAASAYASRRRAGAPAGDRPHDFFLGALFPADEVRILGYDRWVAWPPGREAGDILDALDGRLDVRRSEAATAEQARPAERGSFAMLLDGAWYELTVRSTATSQHGEPLDSVILQEQVLGPVFGIDDPRTDSKLEHVAPAPGQLERRCAERSGIAFVLRPTAVEELMAVADAGHVMPPKSTWFDPKARAGVFVRFVR